ncbi:MAG: hypothetical protein QG604_835 [Candidatus Dependentiae bacterium]|nr:hypothetical protein [Candidatus Dependentiae bacterium]
MKQLLINVITPFFALILLVSFCITPIKAKSPYLIGGVALSAGLGIATARAYSTMKQAGKDYAEESSNENKDALATAKKNFAQRRLATLIAAILTAAIGLGEKRLPSTPTQDNSRTNASTIQTLDTTEQNCYVAQEEARQKEPIFVAVRLGKAKLLTQLINSEAPIDLNQKYWGKFTLLDYASLAIREDLRNGIPISPDKLKIFDILIAHGVKIEDDHELFQLVGSNQTKLVEKLLDMPNGIDINTRNGHEETLLYQAAYCGAVEMVHMLLKRGAKTDIGQQLSWCDFERLPLEAVEERLRYYHAQTTTENEDQLAKIANYEAIAGLLKTYRN